MKVASRRRWAGRVLGVLLGLLGGSVCGWGAEVQEGPNAHALDLQQAFASVFREVEPAIVTVFLETGELSAMEIARYGLRRMPLGLGSGFIVDKRGYIVTNEHVVSGGKRLSVLLSDGTKYDAKLIGKDQLLDIALIRIVLPKAEKGRTFPVVRLGDSDTVRAGMWTITVGNPIGFQFDDPEPVVSVGIVSGIKRTFVDTLEDRREEMRTYGGLIQTDAVVNPGNSGGPLLNIQGEVIGVNTVLWSPTHYYVGLGFAVPINTIRRKLDPMARGAGVKEPMKYGMIEAQLEKLDEITADVLFLKGKRGVYVKQVFEGRAAAAAGMKTYDVILKVAGQRVVNVAQLVSLVVHLPLDEPVPFTVWRVIKVETLYPVCAKWSYPVTMTINVKLRGKTIKEIRDASRRLSH